MWVSSDEPDEPRTYCPEWSESESERQIPYSKTHMQNLEKWYWRIYLQGSHGETDIENRLTDMGRGEERVRCKEELFHWRNWETPLLGAPVGKGGWGRGWGSCPQARHPQLGRKRKSKQEVRETQWHRVTSPPGLGGRRPDHPAPAKMSTPREEGSASFFLSCHHGCLEERSSGYRETA